MTDGNDSTKLAPVDRTDPSLLLMTKMKVINSSPSPNPKVREELFTLKIQVKQEVGVILNNGC